MKKTVTMALTLTMLLAMLTGCGAGSDDDRKIVRIGHVQSQTHPDHLGLEAFANYINEKLGDKYRVEVYPSELLGSQTEMVQLTQTGAIDFVVASTAIMETFSAKYQIFNLPYLFSSVEAYHEAMDDPEVTDPIFKTTSKAGLETVAWLDAGTRNFYTIKTPINQPSDLKGLKIRVMENEIHLAIWTALGANPGPLAFGELYTALQQKSFDAQENPAELIYNTKFYEVQDHVYLTNHIYTPYIIFINLDVWNSLNTQTQELIQECMDEAVAYCREICEENEQACFDAINDSGISQTYEVSEELHNEMVQACTDAGIYDLVIEKAGGTYAEDLWAAAGFTPAA